MLYRTFLNLPDSLFSLIQNMFKHNFVLQMSPESCAKIAVKLDNLTDGEESTTAILDLLKNLIDEQHNIQMMDQNVKKGYRKNRVNKVHPELVPYGRQPTVSFILYSM